MKPLAPCTPRLHISPSCFVTRSTLTYFPAVLSLNLVRRHPARPPPPVSVLVFECTDRHPRLIDASGLLLPARSRHDQPLTLFLFVELHLFSLSFSLFWHGPSHFPSSFSYTFKVQGEHTLAALWPTEKKNSKHFSLFFFYFPSFALFLALVTFG